MSAKGSYENPFDLDPQDSLDYTWDWVEWLGVDTISTIVVVASNGLAVANSAHAQGKVTTTVSVAATLPQRTKKEVTCKITTSAGRASRKAIWFNVVNRNAA